MTEVDGGGSWFGRLLHSEHLKMTSDAARHQLITSDRALDCAGIRLAVEGFSRLETTVEWYTYPRPVGWRKPLGGKTTC